MKRFNGGRAGDVVGIVLGFPQRASLFSSVADTPFPTTLVPLLNVD